VRKRRGCEILILSDADDERAAPGNDDLPGTAVQHGNAEVLPPGHGLSHGFAEIPPKFFAIR